MLNKRKKREKRARRTRSRIVGTDKMPRLSVFRSLNHIYAQLINDKDGRTILFASDSLIKKGDKKEKALQVGKDIAKKALEKGIKEAIFDRGGYKYHGRVKALAEGARQEGLKI